MRKKTYYRILSVFLCMMMIFVSYSGTVAIQEISASMADNAELPENGDDGESVLPLDDEQEETEEDIKAKLMHQIEYEGWDPYSSDMTLDEFYALMELCEEEKLPQKSEVAAIATFNVRADTSQDIPRTLFMYSGLSEANIEGEDAPLMYDNVNGSEDGEYPAGLGEGYQLPPKSWNGVKTEQLQATIVKKRENDDDPTIAGNVVQDLFHKYEGYYVRRLTIQNAEISVLGAIKLDDKYIYYYLTSDSQSTDVSATTLPEGQKFIVQYAPIEHLMSYRVRMAEGSTFKGVDFPTDYETGEGANDAYYELKDFIFGADRTTSTVDRYYSFRATVPDGYTMEIWRQIEGKEEEQVTGKESATGITHNEGWPLGAEPIYDQASGANVLPDTKNGPSTLMLSDTFYNANVTENRTIIAVLKEKGEPKFNAWNLISQVNNMKERGTSAKSSYIYENDSSSANGNYPNIITEDSWNWKNKANDPVDNTMKKEDDGTYSYTWTFQTNASGGNDFLLDSMAVNGVELTIPFSPRAHAWGNGKSKNDIKPDQPAVGEVEGKSYTVQEFPNGMTVRLDYLCLFAWNSDNQRVYRLTITGARSNVTVTGGNLYMYGTGAPEVVIYSLSGIHTGDPLVEAVQCYEGDGNWSNQIESNVYVLSDRAADFFKQRDEHGANIRFKLADGYASPYYYLTTTNNVVIQDQTTVELYNNGEIITDENGSVTLRNESLVSDLDVQDSQHIYGPDADGWYYLRLDTRDEHQLSLLNIGARPVKYVVRYLPTYPAGTMRPAEFDDSNVGRVEKPENMPSFVHYNGQCHESFWWETNNGIPGKQYDDKDGYYYDTIEDTVARVPTTSDMIPTDPDNRYEFVDWVLVDGNAHPVLVDENKKQIRTDEYGNIVLVDESGDPVTTAEGTPVRMTRAGKWADDSGKELTIDADIDTSGWKAVNSEGTAVDTGSLSDFRFLGNPITIAEINEYAILNDGLGATDVDVMVIRLMPTWRVIDNPYNYQVRLLWVDAEGVLQRFDYKGDWRDILTNWDDSSEKLTVKVITESTPFLNWIAQHPTYTFWDDVNNAVDDPDMTVDGAKTAKQKIIDAIAKDIPALTELEDTTNYEYVLNQLLKGSNGEEDEFTRLGNYAFQINKNRGTITICMYENKGGLVFHKDVKSEPFTGDDEFYFTVENIYAGNVQNGRKLDGVYKAYPEVVYDDKGKVRKTLDTDAWLVTFEYGEIVSIVKNDGSAPPKNPVKYFSLKDNEGILLYVPDGRYTITETGSKSGGSYKVKLNYVDINGQTIPKENWEFPTGEPWLKGKAHEYYDPNDPSTPANVSQVSATVDFDIGENAVVQTLMFCNQTSSLAIEKSVGGIRKSSTDFTFDVKLNLPNEVNPLQDAETGKYYFNYNLYNVDYSKNEDGDLTFIKKGSVELTELSGDPKFNWKCENVKLKAGQRMVIVMTVPDQDNSIHYQVQEINIPYPYELGPNQEKIRQNSIKAGETKLEKIVNVTGNLTVINYIEGSHAQDTEMVFTVELSDHNINGKRGDMNFVNGVAKFTLRSGEVKNATLPDGVSYTVREIDSNGYTLNSISGEVKWIENDSGSNAPPQTKITVEKQEAKAYCEISEDEHHTITFIHGSAPEYELPSTGGAGTRIFYLLGGSLTVIAIGYFVLISHKRKRKEISR